MRLAADTGGTFTDLVVERGGESGALLRPYKRAADGEIVELEAWARVVLAPGETIISVSSAGGGYGPPPERDPDRVP